jgi:uncharacterized protein YkwD
MKTIQVLLIFIFLTLVVYILVNTQRQIIDINQYIEEAKKETQIEVKEITEIAEVKDKARQLFDFANEERIKNNLEPYQWSDSLAESALFKAKDMHQNKYFAHTSPTGVTPWDWFQKVSYNYLYAGENLAMGGHQAVVLHDALINSPTHKENIISDNFIEMGVGCFDKYCTQHFGKTWKK